ncbi:hypothetical protein OGATHE_005188 [Ogataea polymorpha]|uniref:Uncharacterized protein n=1 Tax=Ogataea polymorpha TaxID=460523 RepID=A0A9P8SZX3_9ASCO|nr:hypothetical protein OGATHE_005188 [Ogataea polymorpha]
MGPLSMPDVSSRLHTQDTLPQSQRLHPVYLPVQYLLRSPARNSDHRAVRNPTNQAKDAKYLVQSHLCRDASSPQ